MILIILLLIVLVILTVIVYADEDLDDYDPYEYHRARTAYLQAQDNFDQADPEHIDMAIYDMSKTEIGFRNELRKFRIEGIIRSSQDTLTWIALACDGDLQHHLPALNRMTGTLETAIWGYERLYA